MKLRIKPSIPLCALLLLAACSSGGDAPADGTAPEAPVALELSAQMGGVTVETQTRAHDDTWEAGDAIGVFTYPKLSATAEATNVQYTTEAGGDTWVVSEVFIPFAPVGTPIYLSSQEVYVYAYHPYKSDTYANTTPTAYPISVADQSSQEAIDWLVTGRVEFTEPGGSTPISKNNPAVKLRFRHALAKVQVNLLHGEGMKASDLTDVTPTVSIGAGLKTTANLNLFYGTLGSGSLDGASTPITMKHMDTPGSGVFDEGGTKTADQSYEAIILPQQPYTGGVTVTIQMGDVGDGRYGRYYFELRAPTAPEANVFTAGYRYIYNVRVNAKALTVTSTVTPWESGADEAETLHFENN